MNVIISAGKMAKNQLAEKDTKIYRDKKKKAIEIPANIFEK